MDRTAEQIMSIFPTKHHFRNAYKKKGRVTRVFSVSCVQHFMAVCSSNTDRWEAITEKTTQGATKRNSSTA